MTLTEDAFVQAVASLNEMTRRGKVKWYECVPAPMLGLGGFAGQVNFSYCAPYQGKILRVTEHRKGDPLLPVLPALGNLPSYNSTYSLDILGNDGVVLYTFPTVQGVADLFDSIRYQLAGIEDVIQSLITGDPG